MPKLRAPWTPIDWPGTTAGQPIRLALIARQDTPGAPGTLLESHRTSTGVAYVAASLNDENCILDTFDIWIQAPTPSAHSPVERAQLINNSVLDDAWLQRVEALRDLNPTDVLFARSPSESGEVWNVDWTRNCLSRLVHEQTRQPLRLCRDEEQLKAAGLPPYRSTLERWFTVPGPTGQNQWISHDQIRSGKGDFAVGLEAGASPGAGAFNDGGGAIAVLRRLPFSLEGAASWGQGSASGAIEGRDLLSTFDREILDTVAEHHARDAPRATNPVEDLFFSLSLWYLAVRETWLASRRIKTPFFNLSAASFRAVLQTPSPFSPALLPIRVALSCPGEALALQPAPGPPAFAPLEASTGPRAIDRFGGWQTDSGTVRFSQIAAESAGPIRLEGTLDGKLLRDAESSTLVWVHLTAGGNALTFLAQLEGEQGASRAGRRFKASLGAEHAARVEALKRAEAPRQPCDYSLLRSVSATYDVHLLGSVGIRLLLAPTAAGVAEFEDDLLELSSLIPRGSDIHDLETLSRLPELNDRLRQLLQPPSTAGSPATSVPPWLWLAVVHELIEFLAVEDQVSANAAEPTGWLQPLKTRLDALERLMIHTRGLIWAPRPIDEEVRRVVQRFVSTT
ncbi:MAG: hypothetical protein ABIZ04_16170 [Opitutus sp.]